MYGNGQLAARYDLRYDPSTRTSRSILKRIERHASLSSTTPLVSMDLEWIQGSNGFQPDTPFASQSEGYDAYSEGFRMADVNGDGRADLAWISTHREGLTIAMRSCLKLLS